MKQDLQNQEALKKMKELAESVDICMFTTLQDGRMYGRPMSTQEVEDDGTLWFFSDEKASGTQAADGSHVCLNYASIPGNTYLTVQGRAEKVHDEARMKRLWKDILKTWYPDGPDTPGLTLIKVTPESAYYWDNDASRMRILLQYVYAKVTGNYKEMEGREGELEM